MTIVVLWHNAETNQHCCAADTRISGGGDTATDNGPKILPVPVTCFEEMPGQRIWFPTQFRSFGFAYSGSSLSAMSAYGLATACTQNLSGVPGLKRPVSVAAVANLFRSVAQHYILDMSSRLAINDDYSRFFFKAMLFGFCPADRAFKAYTMEPSMVAGACQVILRELSTAAGAIHPMGSGSHVFTKLHDNREREHGDRDPIHTLQEMLAGEVQDDVGGSVQIGVSGQSGFRVLPVLAQGREADAPTVSFLGWDVATAGDIDGYEIGYNAIGFD
ncbi:hypothetical protein [Trinickia mobilis]|uniref:hypothetical protein n=1 Tax=Trinickia mobilis TaxID=2816356 RepID=UPI001A8C7D81|nr:hypothetical protein [Trinickia mobilis]